MKLCAACCATLDASAGSARVPTHSEEPDPPPVAFDCGHFVCGACVRKRRRLAQSCILCLTVDDLLSGGSREVAPADSSRALDPPLYAEEKVEGDFVLGGDSDEEGEQLDSPPPAPPSDPPLADNDGQLDAPPAYEPGGVEVGDADGKSAREQCALHHVRKEDTLLGLSMYYNVEGHVLCQLNKLPLSTLSTTPHLLHTKPFLLLPPTAHRPSSSSEPLLPAPLERKRLVVRRFQVATKVRDWATAQAYVDQVFRAREDEARFIGENRRARGTEAVEDEVREGSELEEAVAAYEADERWEREQRNVKGKGTLVNSPGGHVAGERQGRWGWLR